MKKEVKTIRNELIKANRLEDVIGAVNEVFLIDYSDPTVMKLHIRNGKPILRLSTKDIVNGALIYLSKIYVKEEDLSLSEQEKEALDFFGIYIEDKLEMHLHNYANACSHRHQPEESELEYIRTLSILSNSINYLTMEWWGWDEVPFFDVPEGWRKQ